MATETRKGLTEDKPNVSYITDSEGRSYFVIEDKKNVASEAQMEYHIDKRFYTDDRINRLRLMELQSNVHNYREMLNHHYNPFDQLRKRFVTFYESLSILKTTKIEEEVISEPMEKALVDTMVKAFIKSNTNVDCAFKTYEDDLEYAIVLKEDEAERRGEFSDFVSEGEKAFQLMSNVVIHYISPRFKKSIIHCEVIV